MDTEQLMLDVGQANELKLAFRRTGWTNTDIKKLSEGDLLATLLPVVRGYSEVVAVKHVIDLDADPYVPDGLKVEEHKKGGQFKWDPERVKLYLSDEQKNGTIEGNKLRKELADRPVFNANLLDYLLANPQLIPEEWKEKEVLFWGTIYRSSGGSLCVRYLGWGGVRWYWSYDWLDDDFHGCNPAALLASN